MSSNNNKSNLGVNSIVQSLNIGAVNNAVTAFSSMVNKQLSDLTNNVSGAISTVQSGVSDVVSQVSNIANSSAKNLNALSNQFTNTVNVAISSYNKASSQISSTLSDVKSEFTSTLYDKATSLAEIKSITLPLSSSINSNHGTFKGGNIYKDLNGTIDVQNSNKSKCDGWITLDKSSDKYGLFTTNDNTYIISLNDFESKPLITDFSQLSNLLFSQNHISDTYLQDTHLISSLGATYKNAVANAVNTNLISQLPPQFNLSSSLSAFGLQSGQDSANSKSTIKPIDTGTSVANKYISDMQNKQQAQVSDLATDSKSISNSLNNVTSNTEAIQTTTSEVSTNLNKSLATVQAIIYDIPGYDAKGNFHDTSAGHMIRCYQQPDSVSYTSSAGFDSVSPRGTQQPFQFYQSANAISMSFTLRFRYDFVKLIDNKSLQEIASTAESFTRPWQVGDSITPKLCKVILPGVSRIGYITQANISYSGDLTGETYGVSDDKSATSYHYNTLEISFELLVVQDIELYNQPNASNSNQVNSQPTENQPNSDTLPVTEDDNLQPNVTTLEGEEVYVSNEVNTKQTSKDVCYSEVPNKSELPPDVVAEIDATISSSNQTTSAETDKHMSTVSGNAH